MVGYGGSAGNYHVVRSNSSGGLDDLGVLKGFTSSQANAINNLGLIVGTASSGSGPSTAFLYTATDGLVDLNSLLAPGTGWTLSTATGINDLGQITGTGLYMNQTHAFRLDPAGVPEPSGLILGGLGLFCLLVVWGRGAGALDLKL